MNKLITQRANPYFEVKNIILLTLISTLLYNCGCRDDGTFNHPLSEFEKSVIPFVSEQQVEFTDESPTIFSATVSAKEIQTINLNASDDESCMATFVEVHRNEWILEDTQESFIVEIRKDKLNITEFYIIFQNRYFGINSCDTEIYDAEEFLSDIMLDGFTFTNVFVFELCGIDSDINTIIYSVENGIEFIKYNDGTYLRLI